MPPDRSLPEMRTLSDRIWFHWMRLHTEAGTQSGVLDFTRMIPGVRLPRSNFNTVREMRTFLNWIVLFSIMGEDIGKIVSNCLLTRGIHPSQPGPLWGNHQTFPVGHW